MKSLKPIVLDACCGGRMFWFDKKDPRALFVDERVVEPCKLSNGATFEVKPDMVMDFRRMNLESDQFNLVVFDPPQVVNAGATSFLAKKYGYLKKESWKEDLRAGFSECFRVLKPGGTLIFKWNEMHIPLKDILALTDQRPLFGHRSGKASKTHWVAFIKSN